MLLKPFVPLLLLFTLPWGNSSLHAQQLTGIWSGKISRSTAAYGGVESIEIQLFQTGKVLWGHSFSFKDTSRFVLYRVDGKRNKKEKTVVLQESGYPFYVLPPGFYPCEKNFKLAYTKIGNTQYLTGTWGGIGVGLDTSCFPNEELMVALQKVKNPDYPLQLFVKQKIVAYFNRRKNLKTPDTKDEPLTTEEEKMIPVDVPVVEDSTLAERKLDIQQVLKLTDSIVHISLYDNAVIDDDTVSVFVNKKPVLVKQRISNIALSFDLVANEPGKPVEILMQAENLGSIPPNTALMVIECKGRRYEARLSSSFEKHAVIILSYGPGQ